MLQFHADADNSLIIQQIAQITTNILHARLKLTPPYNGALSSSSAAARWQHLEDSMRILTCQHHYAIATTLHHLAVSGIYAITATLHGGDLASGLKNG
jgi:hypothetical protein